MCMKYFEYLNRLFSKLNQFRMNRTTLVHTLEEKETMLSFVDWVIYGEMML